MLYLHRSASAIAMAVVAGKRIMSHLLKKSAMNVTISLLVVPTLWRLGTPTLGGLLQPQRDTVKTRENK